MNEKSKNKPNREQASERIDELCPLLTYYSKRYYVDDDPVVSDSEYDMLFRELGDLETLYPELRRPDSPTLRVGGAVLDRFEKVTHAIPMGSLSDVFSYEELSEFLCKTDYSGDWSVECKIDGLSVSLEYDGGLLTRGSTRGNGTVGEDVTANLRTVRSIPLSIPYEGHLEVRGEVYMPRRSFARLNEQRDEEGLPTFANPRNAAAGSLRQLDSRIAAERGLDIYIFNIQTCDRSFDGHSDGLDWLVSLGFSVIPFRERLRSTTDIISAIVKIGEERHRLPCDIDGVVIKADDIAARVRIGELSGRPKWAVAYKFPPEQQYTHLLDITVQVGLFYISAQRVVDLGGRVFGQGGVDGGDGCRLRKVRGVGLALALGEENDMAARRVLYVKPPIVALGELHGQLVILQVIAPAEHAVAAARLVLEHTCMPQLAAARLYCTAARAKPSRMSASVLVSTALVESSRISIFGLPSSARAMQIRCF